MKKRLEAELISIAHRILKLKNKSDVDQLYKETQKLYETLAVLKFYQDNFESVKSDVSEKVLEEKLEKVNVAEFAAEPAVEVKSEVVDDVAETEPETEAEEEVAVDQEHQEAEISEETEPTVEEELSEETELEPISAEEPETIDEEEPVHEEQPSFQPIFELDAEEEEQGNKPVKLEDFLGDYKDPVFVKPDEVSLFSSEQNEKPKQTEEEPKTEETPIQDTESSEAKPPLASVTLNESVSKSIAIGLNDRIGFVNHLFSGSNEDFNRVLSQLNTFDTFEEAKTFINEMVIPDYNYWVGEEEYIERFMAIVEKKFQ